MVQAFDGNWYSNSLPSNHLGELFGGLPGRSCPVIFVIDCMVGLAVFTVQLGGTFIYNKAVSAIRRAVDQTEGQSRLHRTGRAQ